MLAVMLFSASSFSQVMSQESSQVLNYQKKAIENSMEVNDKKIKLSEKQKELAEKRTEMEQNAQKAQASADLNTQVAGQLTANPQDKKLSKRATNAAKDAQRDAKNARKTSDSVEKLSKEVEDLQKEIQEKEQELAAAGGMPAPVATGNGLSQAAIPSGQQAMGTENGRATQSAQSTTSAYPTPNAPYTAQGNQMGSTNEGSSAVMAERVIESTYRNYPQQAGQPAIIINNIIVPADVHGGKSQHAQRSGDDVSQADLKEYAEFKEWLRYKRGLSGTSHMAPEPMRPAKSKGFNREPSDSYQEAVSSDGRLSFKDRFAEKPTRNSGMWVIPVAGIHASNFNADFQDGQYDGRAGWNAGLDFRLRVRKFFMQPGIHYFSSSMNVTREDSISTAPFLTGPRIHSLKAPLLAGVYLTQAKGGFFRFNIKGGVVGNYVLNVDQNDDNRFDKDNIEDFSYGLNAGIGLEFGFLTIDLSHEWGMSPLFKDSNQKNNILRATVGFKL